MIYPPRTHLNPNLEGLNSYSQRMIVNRQILFLELVLMFLSWKQNEAEAFASVFLLHQQEWQSAWRNMNKHFKYLSTKSVNDPENKLLASYLIMSNRCSRSNHRESSWFGAFETPTLYDPFHAYIMSVNRPNIRLTSNSSSNDVKLWNNSIDKWTLSSPTSLPRLQCFLLWRVQMLEKGTDLLWLYMLRALVLIQELFVRLF